MAGSEFLETTDCYIGYKGQSEYAHVAFGFGAQHWWQLATAMRYTRNSRSRVPPEKLSFDVLGIIFEYYVETETLFHPLETLLLVSRLWNLAALGHKALWGYFNIHLGHKPTHDAWMIILPRRLERAGSAPLSIEIRYALEGFDHPYYEFTWMCDWEEAASDVFDTCSCIDNAARCAQDLLDILKGPEGEYCKKCTKLHITLGGAHTRKSGDAVCLWHSCLRPLSHPMPLLESIQLKYLSILKPISQISFPSTPLVRTVYFEECTFYSLAGTNFSSAESITMKDIAMERKGIFDVFKFDPPTAIKVIEVHRLDYPSSKIGGLLPHLHSLHLGEQLNDIIAPDFHSPSLKTLTILVPSIFLETFTSLSNRPLSVIKDLTLSQTDLFPQEILMNLKLFLDELESIERITSSRAVLCIVLKYILEAIMQRDGNRIWRNLSGRTLQLVRYTTGSTVQLVFDETMREVDICAAARIFHLPDIMLPWDKISM